MKNKIHPGSAVMLPAGISEIEITADNYMGECSVSEQSGRRQSGQLSYGELRFSIDPNGQATVANNTPGPIYWEKLR